MNKEKRQQLVDLNQKIKLATKLFKELKEEMMPEIGLEAISVWDFFVTKHKKTTVKLDPTIDIKQLIKQYPQYIKFDLAKFAKENKTKALICTTETTTDVMVIKKKKALSD